MYEELVKRLRNRANGSYEEKCEGCEFTEDFPPCVHCTIKAFNDAADAIEELEKPTDAQLDIIKQYQVYLTKQHWMSVAERLPEENTRVIGFMAWKGITAIEYQNGKWYSIDHLQSFPDEAVTHWMPLPQPPKEET